MAAEKSTIQLENVSVSFASGKWPRRQQKVVLDQVDLSVMRGETLGIIGRNGAGKSTLLKLMAGILSPNSGKVLINAQRCILLSYQLGFNNKLTGRENAIYSGLLHGLSLKEVQSRMTQIIAFSGLGEAIDDTLSTYSAGMRARLGFAVSTQSDADVILVDEALGVGDRSFREKSAKFIKSWIRSEKTAVFVSHDEAAVKSLCNKAAWLESGRIVACGPVDEVLDYYHEFDHAVKRISHVLRVPEEQVRAHEKNRDPVSVVRELRRELGSNWQEENRVASRNGVRMFTPGRKLKLSQIAKEDCGAWVWVEQGREVCRGSEEMVAAVRENFESLTSQLVSSTAMDAESLRGSSLYQGLVELVATLSRRRL